MKLIATFIAGLIVGLCAPVSASDSDGGVQAKLDALIGWTKGQSSLNEQIFKIMGRQFEAMDAQRKEYEALGQTFTTTLDMLNGTDSKLLERVGELERRYSRLEAQLKQPRPIVITGDKI